MRNEYLRRVGDLIAAVAFVAGCFLVTGAVQLLFSARPGPDWYDTLRKPPFTPPNWVFGPAWTVLYVCMGLAAWFVWRQRQASAVALPLVLFAVQLALNAAWPVLFFGFHRIGAALTEIFVLWATIAATVWAFFRVSAAAGWLMVPYLGWVTFAAVLNLSIWRLNA